VEHAGTHAFKIVPASRTRDKQAGFSLNKVLRYEPVFPDHPGISSFQKVMLFIIQLNVADILTRLPLIQAIV